MSICVADYARIPIVMQMYLNEGGVCCQPHTAEMEVSEHIQHRHRSRLLLRAGDGRRQFPEGRSQHQIRHEDSIKHLRAPSSTGHRMHLPQPKEHSKITSEDLIQDANLQLVGCRLQQRHDECITKVWS